MNFTTFKRLLKYINRYMILIVISLILTVIKVASTLYLPILTARVLDVITDPEPGYINDVKKILIEMIVVILITVVTQWLINICNNNITYRVIEKMRNEAISKLQKISIKRLERFTSGDLISRIIADAETIGDGLLLGFSQAFSGILTILITLIIMIKLNLIIALIVVVLTPLSLFVASFIAKRSYKMFSNQTKTRGDHTSFITEMIHNQKVVKAYTYEDESEERFGELNDTLSSFSLKGTFYSSLTNPATRFVNNLVYASVGIVGIYFGLKGMITIGTLSIFLSYANQYTKPFNDITSVITELQNAFACAERVFYILDLKEEKNGYGTALYEDTSVEITGGNIEAKGVHFSYEKTKPILQGVDFTINKGEQLAIVGTTGCGKTTLINLLMHFYELDSGVLSVDGHDIKDVSRKALRDSVGMVLQDTWISSGTVAENIAYGVPDASREDIIKAAKACYAHSFIKKLPNGYDTYMGEGGSSLSQGQKQLLCIARVMLKKPQILILDEATSSIDTLTEINVCKAFDKLMMGRTSMIVAHRLSTIKNATKIIVMDKGRIIECGSHDELLEKKGFYANLYESRFAG
ncbi:MAG: ABC transporter ATP-binding protein/permease [Lachnospiraceae bacterium]|nr:ABC transporter ATP-binding protein/permease [Lachnospiraceae bacterium]